MTWWEQFVGAFAMPIILLVLVAWIVRDRRRARREAPCVENGPDGEPYRVYSHDFDLELTPSQIPDALRDASPDQFHGWLDRDGNIWERAKVLADAEHMATVADPGHADSLFRLRTALAGVDSRDLAVTLLVDQSGSMRGRPIACVAAALRSFADTVASTDAQLEILGFSTVGWLGGSAFDHWRWHGRPRRPGRLCALLHIVYKSADEPNWTRMSRNAFLHPDILRENVDGEALLWAANRLRSVSARRKCLIVISDGAPVDDRTLLENGDDYLVRQLVREIATIETDPTIALGAVGIGYAVDSYYARSRQAELDAILPAMVAVIENLLDRPATAE